MSAFALDDGQTHALAAALGGVPGKQVELREHVDPSLLGGLVVRMEGRVYDGSVRGRLRALRAAPGRGTLGA